MDELAHLRGKVDQVMMVALWLHVPLITGVAWFQGNAMFLLGGGAAAVAAAITLAGFSWSADTMRRMAMGVGLVVMVSLLLAATAGGAWQTDIHMYYFAALAVLAAYCDRNVILAAAAVTAVHHLVLSFVAPALVFGGESDLGRVVLHAGILVIEAGALIWLTDYLASLIATNATNLNRADAARVQIEASGKAQEAAQRQAGETRRQTMLDLSGRFEASIGGIVECVASAATELQTTSQAMATTAEETMQQASTVTTASEQATRNVQTVASATEELTASIGQISQQVVAASAMINESVRQAEMSNEQVKGLTEAADKIGDVVRIINGIAGQTNLLALNATIEAARAGDAGKGFAVVASEVKALANQTAKATEEISAHIKAIQEATQLSARLIQGITATIGKVSKTAGTIASAVEEQGAATQEIARNVIRAAEGTQEVSGNITGVSQAAQQTGAAATQVLASAAELSRNGEVLKVQVATFLRDVRAA
ncbi:methyl-accepting chemotaxis protein [Rhodopila sp.]|uniref:methyl-accepting chemotaxis protein n=1 Tax=Rhodopila sp. TaxID=2480087 RepID=UPI003D0F8C26